MRIVLVGLRGSGKTTVSDLLAERLGYECLHLDSMIESRVGNVIEEIVNRFGWEGFRAAERKVIEETSGKDSCVVDAGGGAVVEEKTCLKLILGSIVIYLTADLKELTRRIGDMKGRPALTDISDPMAEMEKMFAERDPIYRRIASMIIDTTNKTPQETASEILNCLQM